MKLEESPDVAQLAAAERFTAVLRSVGSARLALKVFCDGVAAIAKADGEAPTSWCVCMSLVQLGSCGSLQTRPLFDAPTGRTLGVKHSQLTANHLSALLSDGASDSQRVLEEKGRAVFVHVFMQGRAKEQKQCVIIEVSKAGRLADTCALLLAQLVSR